MKSIQSISQSASRRVVVSALSLLGAASCWAYEPLLADSSRVHDLDEVSVVRQSKEQFRLRQQALSSSMYSGEHLWRLGVRDLRELSSFVPNFVMPNYGSRYTSSIYARGIGSRVNSPAVGMYVDGVPLLSRSAYNFHQYDMERVDVLRGPQGTLYGLNTEGGLVRFYSKNPLAYQGTDITVGGGSRGWQNYELAHHVRWSDKVGLSLAGFYNRQNGFFRNEALQGARADNYQEAGGRLRLVLQPTDRWNIALLADYQWTRQNSFPYGKMDAEGNTAPVNYNRQGTYFRNMVTTGLDVNFRANYFDFNSTTSYQFLRDNLFMDVDYLPEDFMAVRERQLQNSLTQEFTLKSRVPVGGFWRWTVGAFGGFQWLKTDAPVYFEDGMDQFLSAPVQRAMYTAMVNSFAGRFMAQGMPREQATAAAQAAIERAGGVQLNMDLQTVPGLFRTPVYNLGFYHESNFDISSRLTATVGLRLDYEHVKLAYDTRATILTTAKVMGRESKVTLTDVLQNRLKDNFTQLLPKFALRYKLSDNGSNLYAVVSKGYRAGGYNFQMFSDILQTELRANSTQRADYTVPHTEQDYINMGKTIAYKPETSWNYEVGSHLNLFDNTVHLDVAAFLMRVNNQQLSVMAGNYGFGRVMVNAGRSQSCGVEVTLGGKAFNNRLDWNLSYGYTRAVFRTYEDSVMVNGKAQVVSYRDKRVPYVPEHTFGGCVDYTQPIATSWLKAITLGVNASGQGRIYWDAANTVSQKLYTVLGAHMEFNFGAVRLNLWGRNLASTSYNTFAVNSAATGKEYWFAQRGNPFQCGADLRIHF